MMGPHSMATWGTSRGCLDDAPKKRPGSLFPTSRAVILATSYSRTTYRCTTIGAAAFHFRVRNGNGWGHCARITRGEVNLRLPIADGRFEIVFRLSKRSKFATVSGDTYVAIFQRTRFSIGNRQSAIANFT